MLTEYGSSFPTDLAANVLVVLLFLSAAVTDVKWNRIYNRQTYPAMALGLLLGFVEAGTGGLLSSLLGLVVGLSLLLLFYLLGGVGAGDVKLLGAIGALMGTTFVIWTMFFTGLVGGVMALAIIIWQGSVKKTMTNLWFFLRHPVRARKAQSQGEYQYLPYGVAISTGCCIALFTM